MNECKKCLGSGINYFICSDPDFKMPPSSCSYCNGSGQDPIPPNETLKMLQMNPIELNEYFRNIPINFNSSSYENYFYEMKITDISTRKRN